MEDRIITNEEVVAAYNLLHAAEGANAPNRYVLRDKASSLAYSYAVQKAKENGLCVENRF